MVIPIPHAQQGISGLNHDQVQQPANQAGGSLSAAFTALKNSNVAAKVSEIACTSVVTANNFFDKYPPLKVAINANF